MIYLDNAATTWPKPESVYQAADRFAREAAGNPGRGGHRMAVAAARAVEETRVALARLFAVLDPNRIIFTANATDALNLALKGLLLPGDHVVTSSMEHNSVSRPLKALEARGVTTTKVRCSPRGELDSDDIRRAVTPATRLVAIAHASNLSGTIQPVAEIGRLVRELGLLLLVDAAQTAGSLSIAIEEDGIDLLAFPGHKGLLGPMGTGGLVVGERVSPSMLQPVREGGTGGNSAEDVPPTLPPLRYEAGTVNAVGIAGLGAGVKWVLDAGVEVIRAREAELTRRLRAGLDEIDEVEIAGPPVDRETVGVVSFTVAGWDPEDIGAILDQRYDIACRTGLHCAPDAARTLGVFPTGTVRFSLGPFTTDDEIDAAISAVQEIARA